MSARESIRLKEHFFSNSTKRAFPFLMLPRFALDQLSPSESLMIESTVWLIYPTKQVIVKLF